jgi:hypothetical protein
MFQDFGAIVMTPVKAGNLYLFTVVATFTNGTGAFTQDLALSTPGAVLTYASQGNLTVTLPSPQAQALVPFSHGMSRAITLGTSVQIFHEVINLPARTVTYVTQNPAALGTDAHPASGDVVRIQILAVGY